MGPVDETAELRRRIEELQSSLSWRITSPLRFLAKPFFRARAQEKKTAVATRVVAPPNGAAATPAPMPPRLDREERRSDITGTPAGPTIDTLCTFYKVPPEFAHGILLRFVGDNYDRNLGDIEQLQARYAQYQIQLHYALSTNARGRDLAKQLKAWGVPVEPEKKPRKSYLDVGFAYGGSLAAFAEMGYQVTGIEISQELAHLGRLNLESLGPAVTTLTGDFLSEELITGERQFDLITCCDVIEHVMDPETALRKICRLLKPGGAAYIAFPTRLSVPYVRADAHSQLFGLTLLDYYRARAAFTMYTGWPYYEVSDFYEPEWYLNTARLAGVQAELLYDDTLPVPDIPDEIAQLYQAFSEWTRTGSRKLEPLMRHEITLEMAKYSARLFREYSEHIASNSLDQFARKWIDRLTRILVRKPSV